MLVFPRRTEAGCCDLCVAPAVEVYLIALAVRASAIAACLPVTNSIKAHTERPSSGYGDGA